MKNGELSLLSFCFYFLLCAFMKIVFTGIQWCGKWTQARILVEKYGFTLVEMWNEFRSIIESGSDLWNQLKVIMDAGHQVNEGLWKQVMETAIYAQKDENIIFDGFVRNERNKEIFDRLLPDYKVLFFNLSKEKAISRLLWRMYDPKTGETFASWTTRNPITGTELLKRADDNEDAILTRINAFVTTTLPVVEAQKQEWRVIEIDADQSVEKVAQDIKDKLWL